MHDNFPDHEEKRRFYLVYFRRVGRTPDVNGNIMPSDR